MPRGEKRDSLSRHWLLTEKKKPGLLDFTVSEAERFVNIRYQG